MKLGSILQNFLLLWANLQIIKPSLFLLEPAASGVGTPSSNPTLDTKLQTLYVDNQVSFIEYLICMASWYTNYIGKIYSLV